MLAAVGCLWSVCVCVLYVPVCVQVIKQTTSAVRFTGQAAAAAVVRCQLYLRLDQLHCPTLRRRRSSSRSPSAGSRGRSFTKWKSSLAAQVRAACPAALAIYVAIAAKRHQIKMLLQGLENSTTQRPLFCVCLCAHFTQRFALFILISAFFSATAARNKFSSLRVFLFACFVIGSGDQPTLQLLLQLGI